MHRIDRHFRHIAVAIASALLIACGSDEATAPREDQPPTEQPPVENPAPVATGSWAAQRIYGKPLPAVIAGGVDDGVTWEVRALYDSLIVRPDGRWVQKVLTEQSQSDGFYARGVWGDKGTWTREGNILRFESDWIENVSFTARLTPEGALLVDHNFTLDESLPPMTREMKK
jgi:hypothetical protein